ncbi:DUF6232 family protein [Streptomyces zhihengii]|uniref:DUF6232 family protein n=1 Tax=Streptomyces zhihengii TaxID=1818004 RepID=UPI0036BF752B
MRVGANLLWVGEAAYPLRNITRVHTFVLKPKRMDAFFSFLKWFAITALCSLVLASTNENSSSSGDWEQTVFALGGVVAIGLVVQLVKELAAPSQHVLEVETSGASTAMVTLPDPARLRRLLEALVHAIEHPEVEFQMRVERVLVNPKNYHFGDNVNMYGGINNTGVSK